MKLQKTRRTHSCLTFAAILGETLVLILLSLSSVNAQTTMIRFLDKGTGDSIEISLLAPSETIYLTEKGKRQKAKLKKHPKNRVSITRLDGSVLSLTLDPAKQTFTDGKRLFSIPDADKAGILEAQKARAREFQCLQNAQYLSIACRTYAKVNGAYPAKLEDIFTKSNKYTNLTADKLYSPFDEKRDSLSYELLVPGKKIEEVGAGDLLIRASFLSPGGLRAVVYGDQRATFLKK